MRSETYPVLSAVNERRIPRRLEMKIAHSIVAFPEDVAGDEIISELFGEDHMPGTFMFGERKDNPEFLKWEKIRDYAEWVKNMVRNDLKSIESIGELDRPLDEEFINEVGEAVLRILDFRLPNDGKQLNEVITNQEFTDVMRRIIAMLLTGNPETVFYTSRKFNELGRRIAFAILSQSEELSLFDRLKQSIAAGLIGVNIKESVASGSGTGAIELQVDTLSDKISSVKERLTEVMNQDLAIDFWPEYKEEVLESNGPFSLVFFTDDYIETFFDLKRIAEELKYNPRLTIHLVPKGGRYGNDASYEDVLELLKEPIFSDLATFQDQGRFTVTDKGPRMGGVNGKKISMEVAMLLKDTDAGWVKGARPYEMLQGIRKPTYFAFAVYFEFSESTTGLNSDASPIVLIRVDPGGPSFANFRARGHRTYTFANGKVIGIAQMTALEYHRAIKSKNYQNLLQVFDADKDAVNEWIVEQARRNNKTFAEIIAEI